MNDNCHTHTHTHTVGLGNIETSSFLFGSYFVVEKHTQSHSSRVEERKEKLDRKVRRQRETVEDLWMRGVCGFGSLVSGEMERKSILATPIVSR